jgi:hypothetical protein
VKNITSKMSLPQIISLKVIGYAPSRLRFDLRGRFSSPVLRQTREYPAVNQSSIYTKV